MRIKINIRLVKTIPTCDTMSLPSEGHAVLCFRNLLIIPKKELDLQREESCVILVVGNGTAWKDADLDQNYTAMPDKTDSKKNFMFQFTC